MTPIRSILVLLLGLGLAPGAPARAEPTAREVGAVPTALRKALRLDAFYAKHVDCHGFPILGSRRVSDRALLEAAWIIDRMTAGRRELLGALARAKVRCCVMAHDEMTTTVPEHRTLEPARWWDRRARGLGPSTARPCVSCAEENLLAFPGDPYPRESILVHEFAHAVDLMALRTVDPAFESKLAAAYRSALAGGLWKGTYAAENKEEYWAEGVQSWFDTNRPEDGLHNGIDTRRELIQYDPQLARLIGEALGKGTWRYVHPRDRLGQAHLAGYDPAQAPRFRWPEGLDAWFREHERSERAGAGHVELEPLPATEAPRRSPATRDATRIVFRNRTADAVTLFWVDHGGQRVAYGSVDAGADVERATLVGHVWIAVDATGKDLACFIASRRLGRAVIRPRGLGR